ncbi:MAG: hypothetical protein K9W44_13625 [Candidatus Lokiarchaeota archaeon]|nr:hypothetical protein [Candidatus Harpocratesius repetitus]
MIKRDNFSDFSFNELINMVNTIARTKHRSRQDVWTEGYGLQSIDHLESHVDEILEELAYRIRQSFNIGRIQSNFRHNKESLPHDILNFNNLNATQLNAMLFKERGSVGAEVNENGEEEIFIVIKGIKYKMKSNGVIIME